MAATAWDKSLGILDSFEILRQCSLFLSSQHESDKICFYPTRIVIEGNSRIWRTGAQLYGGIQKLIWGTDPEPSRDLEKVVKLISKGTPVCSAEMSIFFTILKTLRGKGMHGSIC